MNVAPNEAQTHLCRFTNLVYKPPEVPCYCDLLFTNLCLVWHLPQVSDNGLGDLGSILRRVIPKTLKMVLDTSLLNTQQYKVRIEGQVEQSRGKSSTLPYTSV